MLFSGLGNAVVDDKQEAALELLVTVLSHMSHCRGMQSAGNLTAAEEQQSQKSRLRSPGRAMKRDTQPW